jgi:ribonuclease VapC
MIVDSSAIVAIVFQEKGFEEVLHKLLTSENAAIGAPTLIESAIVISARLRKDARALLSRIIMEASIVVIPFDEVHFGTSVEAWLRYGKGRHSAKLNFGDCLAYATAKIAGQPLLCTGTDFSKTDIEVA